MQSQNISVTLHNEFDITKWLYQLFADLEMARKIVISPDRRVFIAQKLTEHGFTQEKAKQAEMWILYGDWSMKGNDPTMTLDDLYPSAAEYASALQKFNGNLTRKSQLYVAENKEVATPKEAEEMLKLLHQKIGNQ